MDDKKYYTDDQRRRYAIDLRTITFRQSEDLQMECLCMSSSKEWPYLSWSEIVQDFYITSNIEDEGLILVSYDEFIRINRLNP